MAARNIRPLFDGDELVADISTIDEVTVEALEDSVSKGAAPRETR